MEAESIPPIKFKVMVLGDTGVGKTSLIMSYVNNRGWRSAKPSIGADFSSKILNMNGKQVSLQMWDTAGQERYRILSEVFFRETQAVLFVFDLSNPLSFHDLDYWYGEFIVHVDLKPGKRFPIGVVGNKSDAATLESNKTVRVETVKDETIKEWCKKKGAIPYFYTSAKEGMDVQQPFDYIARDCLAVYHPDIISERILADVSEEQHDATSCNALLCHGCSI